MRRRTVRAVQTDRGLRCPCGRERLRAFKASLSETPNSMCLESHLPPWEKNPHRFCEYSHLAIDDGDETPLGKPMGHRKDVGVEAWALCGRPDDDIINPHEYVNVPIAKFIGGVAMTSRADRIKI